MTAELVSVEGFVAAGAQAPRVDLVIAVHDVERQVARAVTSVVGPHSGGDGGAVRVTLACHELDATIVTSRLDPALGPFVRAIEVRDGSGSPSGPFNAGIDHATAPFVAIMGSDDYLEPGAVAAWLSRAESTGADVVLARLRAQGGSPINTPRARPLRSSNLDPVKDRLAYRTAPLGLLRRQTLDRLGLRLEEGMKVGGDIALTVRLWAEARRVDIARRAPAYVVGADAPTRVTTQVRPVEVSLRPYVELLDSPWFRALTPAYRRAVAVKVLRIHVLDNVMRRHTVAAWAPGEVEHVRSVCRALVSVAEDVLRPFSRADRVVLDECLSPASTAESLVAAARARAAAPRAARLLPPRPLDALDRESTVRYLAADRFWP